MFKVDLDTYKDYFCEESNQAIITHLIKEQDYNNLKTFAEWKHTKPKYLDAMAKFMLKLIKSDVATSDFIFVLMAVAENPKARTKTLTEICEFACNNSFYCDAEVLVSLSKNKHINGYIANRIYDTLNKCDIVELMRNGKTPDDLLIKTINDQKINANARAIAGAQLAKRYAKLKKESESQKE